MALRARLLEKVGVSEPTKSPRDFTADDAVRVYLWLTKRGVITTSIRQYGAMSKEEITPVSRGVVERGESAVNYTASVLLTGQVPRRVDCIVR